MCPEVDRAAFDIGTHRGTPEVLEAFDLAEIRQA